MASYSAARESMVVGQIIPSGITSSRIINAMASVPRELFVPDSQREIAYIDGAIELQAHRFIVPPMVFARMVQALNLSDRDKVLDIGCASGYSTAVLSYIAGVVVGLENNLGLTKQAEELLEQLECDNAAIVKGTLNQGDISNAPFDAIMVQGAVEYVPKALLEQLSDGGRLVAVVQNNRAIGSVTLFTRTDSNISKQTLFEACLPTLKGFKLSEDFEF